MQDNNEPRTINDIIAGEPDLLRRCALINFNMDALQSPEDALLSHNVPAEIYAQWAEKHFENLVSLAAQATGADPEQIADKDRRTPEQQKALLEASAREQLARLDIVINSNYRAAIKHIKEYCIAVADAGGEDIYKPLRDEAQPEALQSGQLVNAPLAAVLYFFATHEDIDPRARDSLTAADKGTIIENFNSIDTFYKEHRAELHTEQELLRGFIESIKPNPARAQETLQRISALAIIPDSRITPNNKLANSLTRATRKPEDAIEIIMTVCEMGKGKNKTVITSSCILTYEGDNVKISGRQPFTEFDRNVYDAVCSLYAAGNRVFTSDMVWRAMLERTAQEQPTPGQKAAITKSIDKMRFMRAQIDCSDEFKARRIDLNGQNITGAGYDDNLLHLSVTWVTAGKNTIRAYEFPQEARFAPVLYQYSAAVKELITTPVGLLDIKKLDKTGKPTTRSVEYTERRVVINGYLRRRIEGMKGKNGLHSRYIRFTDYVKDGQTHEGLYSVAGCPELSQPMPEGLTDAEKTKRKNDARYIREDAKLALDYWTAIGYIKGSKDYRDGKTVTGFEIALTQADLDAWKKADK